MKKFLVLFLVFQVAPAFAANYRAGYENVCAKYGCTIPPIEASFDQPQTGWR